jgi:YhcH/YjgK/YiaL family protein
MDIGFNYLRNTDLTQLEPGIHPIYGSDVYALVKTPKSVLRSEGVWVSHKHYAEILYLVDGVEEIGFQKTDRLTICQYYDEHKDITLYDDNREGSFFSFQPGMFAVCFPSDAHMTRIGKGESTIIKKVVVKVRHTERQ